MTAPLPGRNPEERRLATVLFADVHGFTSLAEQLDFETVSDLIKEIWLRLDAIIEAHGGYIDKHVGDGVMAVWGAPQAGDDDAENAVAAALAMQVSLDEFARMSPRTSARELKLRVGINTGMVLAGYVGVREEYTVMGDSVNVARRLEQTAEPGTVLISESTYYLVRGVFQVRRLPPLQLKGRSDAVSAFQVEGFVAQPSKVRYRSAGGLDTRMVAREAELGRLSTLFERVSKSGMPTLVLVTGEAGIGKSRLLMEFTSQLEADQPDLTLISARALSQTSRAPFFLWKSLWFNRFGLQEEDPPDVAREKFVSGISLLMDEPPESEAVQETAHLIGSLTGLDWPASVHLAAFTDSPGGRVQRAFLLTRELLARTAGRGPTVLLLDDLHWADSVSLDVLTFLLESSDAPLSLLILGGARPELIRQQPRWANLARVITLKPLPVEAELVAQAYPALRTLPKTVLAELAWRSDGNPYFLEELVKSLVKSGLADDEVSEEEIIQRLRTQPPESLRAMLQARLDALYLEAREVLLLASVVGRVFWVGAVLEAARASQEIGTGFLSGTAFLRPSTDLMTDMVKDALQQLVWAEMVFPRAGTQFSDEQEYIFKHSLLRDVAYSLLPIKYRRQHHLAVARWLANRKDPDFRVMVATHLEKAGAFDEAALQYEAASREAQVRGAAREAQWLRERAQEMQEKIASLQ